MGWRHKKADAGEFRELRLPAILAPGNQPGAQIVAPPGDGLQREPALPPLMKPRLTCRQVGCFRGRKIYETGISLSCLHYI